MQDRQTQGSRTLKRLLLLASSFAVGAVVWFMLGDSESVTAAEAAVVSESPVASQSSAPERADKVSSVPLRGNVLARVNGEPITEAAVKEAIADQLVEIERQRHALIARAVDDEVHHRLLDAEAEKRGMSRDELLRAAAARVEDAELQAFYETHGEPIDEPAARRTIAYEALIGMLADAAEVEIFTPPFRAAAATAG